MPWTLASAASACFLTLAACQGPAIVLSGEGVGCDDGYPGEYDAPYYVTMQCSSDGVAAEAMLSSAPVA